MLGAADEPDARKDQRDPEHLGNADALMLNADAGAGPRARVRYGLRSNDIVADESVQRSGQVSRTENIDGMRIVGCDDVGVDIEVHVAAGSIGGAAALRDFNSRDVVAE